MIRPCSSSAVHRRSVRARPARRPPRSRLSLRPRLQLDGRRSRRSRRSRRRRSTSRDDLRCVGSERGAALHHKVTTPTGFIDTSSLPQHQQQQSVPSCHVEAKEVEETTFAAPLGVPCHSRRRGVSRALARDAEVRLAVRSSGAMDSARENLRLLRLRQRLPDRRWSWRDRRRRSHARHPTAEVERRGQCSTKPTRFGIEAASFAATAPTDRRGPWLVSSKTRAPHLPVFDKSNRTDGTFSRADFAFDAERDRYTCPAGKELVQFRRTYAVPRSGVTAEGQDFIAPANWIATPAD